MSDLDALEDWVAPLIQKLSYKQRRALARKVAQAMRREQRERIKAQQNPDGSRFAPRKPQHRAQQGGIRRKAMFKKLRTAKYLKAKGQSGRAEVGFVGRVARLARVHHYGLRDKVDRDGPYYRYPERRLLGIAHEDRERVRDLIIDHLDL